ncbi:MAG: zinc dependent phospholipase C family protein [Candidatus Limivivens sp.]|nr:zinc dependent phospholipase C family protein [Candidatus Limivivens sp.]
MPTTYTHDIFGKNVYQKLPEELQSLIAGHMTAYRIGLHGPDILFYYKPFSENKINEMGRRLHREKAAGFFKACKALVRTDEETAAYVLGFICHYMLDSTCHPYIGEYMRKTGAAHDEIETDLDRVLMEMTGRDPFSYRPGAFITAGGELPSRLEKVFQGQVSGREIRTALRSMRFYTGITVCRTNLKRYALLELLKLLGGYDAMQGHVMRKKRCKRCIQSTQELQTRMRLAVPETVCILEEYWNTRYDDEYLNARFERNYE